MNNQNNAITKILFLLFIMLVAMTTSVNAAPTAYAEYNDGTGTLTFKYGTMPSGTYVYDVTNTGDKDSPWEELTSSVKKVVFDSSFSSARPISCAKWFYDMGYLKSIEGIGNLNTSSVTTMYAMFAYCNFLTLDVSGFNTSNVTDMSYMFVYCSKLTSLDLSSFNTSSVTDMTGIFGGCSSLTNINVSSFDTSNVTYMTDMFYGCSSLTSIDVSSFDTSNVTQMTDMFYGCSSLTNIDVSSFNTSNVIGMSYMFHGCSSLMSIDVSNFNTSSLRDAIEMFSECSNLKTIYCNDSWNCKYSTNMFYGCSSLVGAISYNPDNLEVEYANPATGYFTYVTYGLTICGTAITKENYDKISTINGVTGSISYDPDNKILTLKNCSILYFDGAAIKSEKNSLNVRLVGSNGILAATGIESNSDLTILGDGVLSVMATGTGINMAGTRSGGKLAISDGAKVTIIAGTEGICGAYSTSINRTTGEVTRVYRKSFRVSGSSTNVKITANTATVVDIKNMVMEDGLALTAPIGAQFKNNAVCDADGNVVVDESVRISLLGDANGDGNITMADANMVVNYFLATKKSDIHGFDINNANANGDADEDGQPIITMADANAIVNMFLGQ